MAKLVVGINDLATLHPEIAAEADGWDPCTLTPGSSKKVSWKCEKGHTWDAVVCDRTGKNSGCPYCTNKKVWSGFNDLKTLFPEVAKEADGWDPFTVLAGSGKKVSWKCKQEHQWNASPSQRVLGKGTSCPYCSNNKVWSGFNDLKTLFPEVAKEADGWDTQTVLSQSKKKMAWKCDKGHQWNASIGNRTKNKARCPYCTNKYALSGFNDLKTLFPEVAKEADGWDPSLVLPSSNKKFSWKCQQGHSWDAAAYSRTNGDRGCPYCAGKKVWDGFNDLKTLFPEVAKEADGWDPSLVLAGTHKKMPWKCSKGHTWSAVVDSRTRLDADCPYCTPGFNPGKPAWFYLMQRNDQQQLGITNNLPKRIGRHSSKGWKLLEKTGPHSGKDVLETERSAKRWLKKEVGLVPHTQENWYTSKMEVHSLAELKEKSGIETSIF